MWNLWVKHGPHRCGCHHTDKAYDSTYELWCDFQQCDILTWIDTDETLNFVRSVAKALLRLCVCAGWSETLLVAHITLLEISCCIYYMLNTQGKGLYCTVPCTWTESRPFLYWVTLCNVCFLQFLALQKVFLCFGTFTWNEILINRSRYS